MSKQIPYNSFKGFSDLFRYRLSKQKKPIVVVVAPPAVGKSTSANFISTQYGVRILDGDLFGVPLGDYTDPRPSQFAFEISVGLLQENVLVNDVLFLCSDNCEAAIFGLSETFTINLFLMMPIGAAAYTKQCRARKMKVSDEFGKIYRDLLGNSLSSKSVVFREYISIPDNVDMGGGERFTHEEERTKPNSLEELVSIMSFFKVLDHNDVYSILHALRKRIKGFNSRNLKSSRSRR